MRLLFTLLLVFCAGISQAQMCPCAFGGKEGDKILRWELGLNLLNAREVLVNFYSPKPEYSVNTSNGILLKYHLDKISLRAGFDYGEHSYNYETGDGVLNYNHNTGKLFGNYFRVGIEKTFFTQKLQLFMSGDFVYTTEKYAGTTEGYGDFMPAYKNRYRLHTASYGVSPGLGLKYRPFKNFSISAETGLNLVYYYSSSIEGNYTGESNVALLFNPLRTFSLNFHF